jgi:1,4-dihydroxy-6-naphthoate synthase
MQLSLAISPCPNDTFSFYHLLHSAESNQPFTLHTAFADIEALNRDLLIGKHDVSKASFGLIPKISDAYQILDSGAALGFGCGPLLIAKNEIPLDQISKLKIAIPGINTTANRLLNLAFGEITSSVEIVFSEIEEAVSARKVDAGLIIHESRFTYAAKGLKKIIDLGQWWEEQFAVPVPLGCIVVRRSLPEEVKSQIQREIAESIEKAFLNPQSTMHFVEQNAQEMEHAVMQQHIDLYVNRYSISLGEQGRSAVRMLLQQGGTILREPLFLD